MGKRFIKIPRKTIERARLLYESGSTVVSILAEVNIASSTFYRYVEEEGWSRPAAKALHALKSARKAEATTLAKSPKSPPARVAGTEGEDSSPSIVGPPARRHDALIERLYQVAERQVADIERRIGQTSDSLAARERDARHFSSMVRMMRELAALELSRANAGGEARAAENEDVDIEQVAADYRAELERVLDAMRERGAQQQGNRTENAGGAAAKPDGELELPREERPASA